MKPPKLSICISTYNRAKFIAETLSSIFAQAGEEDVEVIVVDGASPDDTMSQVTPFLSKHPNLRYFHETINSGVDGDYDKAVHNATGEYCWLMSDDDLLNPGAILRVLGAIQNSHELIVVNAECWNADLTKNLQTKMLKLTGDKVYSSDDKDSIMAELATCLSYIGSVIIKRSAWIERERKSYYGSLFIHIGVIFQHNPITRIFAIADPQIKIRYGNGMWTPRSFEIWYFKWPKLIWSFPDFSDRSKQVIVPREPWRQFIRIFKSRALGDYTTAEFRKFLSSEPLSIDLILAFLVSIFPAKLANFIWVSYYSLIQRSAKYTLFDLLRSQNSSLVSRSLASAVGIKVV